MRNWSTAALGVALAGLLGGCALSEDSVAVNTSPAQEVAASLHCGLTAPGAVLVQSREDLQRLASVPGMNLDLGSLPTENLKQQPLVVVSQGQKPTAGYSVSLKAAGLNGDRLLLAMAISEPRADAMVAQVLTTPCVVVAVTAEGWQTLTVEGQGLPEITRQRSADANNR
ncbi:MAG: protease complex subunit PrcB family protein [Pseudomonadales bacterium]|nr:protease complex subunit PrcB family protein [Pseudomonadales bacterium]